MPNSTNTLALTLTQTDSIGGTVLSRTPPNFAYSGTVGEFVLGSVPSTSATTLSLPVSQAQQFYFKNASTASSSVANTLTLSWTPGSSGVATALAPIGPGGVVALWGIASSSQTGITGLSVVASNASIAYEMFLGG